MKILITQETDWLKRNPLQQHHLAEMLSRRGHEIRVIDYELLWRQQSKKERYSRREVFQNVSKIYSGGQVTVIRPGIIKMPWLEYVSLIVTHRKEIQRQIKEFKPDVIVGFGILNSYLAVKAAKKNNIPFVYHWLDVLHWLIPFKPFQPIGQMIESKTLRQTDRVIVVSDKLKDFVTKLGASPERVEIVKPGISLQQFNPSVSGTDVRKQYKINKDNTVLFFMGWLYHFSGLKEVAMEMARTKDNNVKLLIVGEGDAFDDLKQIQEQYKLEDKLILTGKKPYNEIPGFIAASDICLLPAYPAEKIMHDGLPAKIYEYLAMQKPMISTRLPGVMKEFGQDNGVVYIDQPADVIVKANELVHNNQVAELGAKARRFVESYSWDKITDQFERILTEVIKEKKDGAIS
ncbi:MAG: glycosyltransferase family 4 protein [Dehalococcoidales bacterium]|nr:glycosyltransferase family 4 protein [Dehalococcoidales bacterium]